MPRNRSRTTSARPTSTKSAPIKRESSTMTAPPPAPVASTPSVIHVPQQQGILSQIATTAAGVAAGHVAGRMVMGLFSGESAAAEPTNATATPTSPTNAMGQRVAPQCQEYSRLFLQCLEQNDNQVATCRDYMDMMKACQQQYAA